MLTVSVDTADARRIAIQGLANLSTDAMRLLSEAVRDGDVRTAQWVVAQLLELEDFAAVAAKQAGAGALALPEDPTARKQTLEGLRLIKQAERRTS